jgi:hypothetical protein
MATAGRGDVRAMRVMELHALVLAEGIEPEAADGAMDEDDPKAALIALLKTEGSSAPPGRILDCLGSDSAAERATGYDLIDALADDDVEVAVAVAVPLDAVLTRDASDVGPDEWRRAALALARLVSFDCVRVGGEWLRDSSHLRVWASEASSLAQVLSKLPSELTPADSALCAADQSALSAAFFVRGLDYPLGAAGMTGMQAYFALYANLPFGDDDWRIQMSTLALEALRDGRGEMSEQLATGYWAGYVGVVELATCQRQLAPGHVRRLRAGSRGPADAGAARVGERQSVPLRARRCCD